ncbi:MAG: tRNA 2-selenouridine(34) synthase MnmH [Bacteroidia bacterium]
MQNFTPAQSKSLSMENFIQEGITGTLVDVRSPVEFANGHIPGAINIPLFDDHERAEIGTLYKVKGKEEAVMRGIEIVSPKLAGFIRSVKEKNDGKERVLIYCFRGGMRSSSFCWLMDTAGVNAVKLEGGYKNYRANALGLFTKPHKIVLIGGSTGSGKTEVLKKLQELKAQTLDLEGIANHKGSVFGFIGQKEQPAQQQFENNLFQELHKLDPSDLIFVEDESFAIGSVKLPYPFWLQMKEAPIVKLKVPFDLRVKRLVEEYGQVSIETLRKPLLQIKARLGPQHCKNALEHLEKGELDKVAEITLHYYDKAYEFSHEKRKYRNVFDIETSTDNATINARLILDFVNQPTFKKIYA